MQRGEEKGDDGAIGEEDNGIYEISATGVNKPPAPFNKHHQERRPHGKPAPAPSDAVKLAIKHKVKMARSGCRPPVKGGASGGSLHRFMVPRWRLRASLCSFISKRCTPQSVAYSGNGQSLEDDSSHQYRLTAFSKAFIILGTSTVLTPWLQVPLTYLTNRAKGVNRWCPTPSPCLSANAPNGPPIKYQLIVLD